MMSTIDPLPKKIESSPGRTEPLEFHPHEPPDLSIAGLSETLVDSLLCKHLLLHHSAGGRAIASAVGLPFSIVEKRLAALKLRRFISSTNVSSIGDFTYHLAEEGKSRRCAGWTPVAIPEQRLCPSTTMWIP